MKQSKSHLKSHYHIFGVHDSIFLFMQKNSLQKDLHILCLPGPLSTICITSYPHHATPETSVNNPTRVSLPYPVGVCLSAPFSSTYVQASVCMLENLIYNLKTKFHHFLHLLFLHFSWKSFHVKHHFLKCNKGIPGGSR